MVVEPPGVGAPAIAKVAALVTVKAEPEVTVGWRIWVRLTPVAVVMFVLPESVKVEAI